MMTASISSTPEKLPHTGKACGFYRRRRGGTQGQKWTGGKGLKRLAGRGWPGLPYNPPHPLFFGGEPQPPPPPTPPPHPLLSGRTPPPPPPATPPAAPSWPVPRPSPPAPRPPEW